MLLYYKLLVPERDKETNRWLSEPVVYDKVVQIGRSERAIAMGNSIVKNSPYTYTIMDFDNPVVCLYVTIVDYYTARKLRSKAKGLGVHSRMITATKMHNKVLLEV